MPTLFCRGLLNYRLQNSTIVVSDKVFLAPQNHQPATEGDWNERRLRALQV